MAPEHSSFPSGTIAPIPTPLKNGDVEPAILGRLLDVLVPEVDGIFVLGSSGEHPWHPDNVGIEVAKTVVSEVDGRVPVLLGASDLGASRTIKRLETAAELGVDYLVLALPAYFPVADSHSQIEYFTTLAENAYQPIILYNIPQNVGQSLHPRAVAMLARHPNIVGIKDSAGDVFAFQQYLEVASDNFTVLQGREQLARASLLEGAVGTISAMANVAPSLLRSLASAVDSGDLEGSNALQRTITRLSAIFDHGYWLSALKCSLSILGLEVGPPSFPIAPCTDQERAEVAAILAMAEFTPWLVDFRGEHL